MPCQPQISGCKGSIRRTGRWNNAGSGSATVPATHFGRHTLWGTMRIEFQVRPKTILSEKPICLGFVRSDNHYVYLQPISSSASVASICVQPSATTVTSYMTGMLRTAGVSGSTISNNYAISRHNLLSVSPADVCIGLHSVCFIKACLSVCRNQVRNWHFERDHDRQPEMVMDSIVPIDRRRQPRRREPSSPLWPVQCLWPFVGR